MQRNFVCAWALGFSSLAFANGTEPSTSYPYPIDLHANNRAIAFGSALMVTENHSDPASWKKVEAQIGCATTGSGAGSSQAPGEAPIPAPPPAPGPAPIPGSPLQLPPIRLLCDPLQSGGMRRRPRLHRAQR